MSSTKLSKLPVFVAVVVASILMITSAPVSAAAPTSVSLAALHSGKCLEVEGASLDYAARVQQASCNGAAHQALHYDEATAHLVMKHSGMCLEISPSIIALGAPVWQAPCNKQAVMQIFKVTAPPAPGAVVTIVVPASRMCLDVFHASFEDGASVVQWTCDPDRPSQSWKVLA